MEIKFTLSQECIDKLFAEIIGYMELKEENDIENAQCIFHEAVKEFAIETSLMSIEDAADGYNDDGIDDLSYYVHTRLNTLKGRPRLEGIIKEVV